MGKLKDINIKIESMWQSKNTSYDSRSLIILSISFAILSVCSFYSLNNYSNMIIKLILIYFLIAFADISVISLYTLFYIHNIFNAKYVSFLKTFYKGFLIISFALLVPIFIIMKMVEMLIGFRAKKIDNIEIVLFVFIIDMVILLMTINENVFLSNYFASQVEKLLNYFINIEIKKNTLIFFFILCIFKIEMDVINTIIFNNIEKKRHKKIKRDIYLTEKNIINNSQSNIDIQKFINDKNAKIESIKEKKEIELRHDVKYYKDSFSYLQLLAIIILFVFVVFSKDVNIFPIKQEEIINVITVFTLIILYYDKAIYDYLKK